MNPAIGTQNVDLDPFGKPPDLHHHIIMDLDLFGMHMHKHTFPDGRLLSSACLFTNNLEIISNVGHSVSDQPIFC